VFGNKAFGVRLAAALAVVALLGVASVKLEERIRPTLDKILLQAEASDGARVHVAEGRVTASDASGFVLEADGVRARVTPAAPVAPGDRIALTARIEARGPSLRLEEFRKLPGGWSAPYGGLLSIVLLLLVALNFVRHFAWRPEAARVEGVPE